MMATQSAQNENLTKFTSFGHQQPGAILQPNLDMGLNPNEKPQQPHQLSMNANEIIAQPQAPNHQDLAPQFPISREQLPAAQIGNPVSGNLQSNPQQRQEGGETGAFSQPLCSEKLQEKLHDGKYLFRISKKFLKKR